MAIHSFTTRLLNGVLRRLAASELKNNKPQTVQVSSFFFFFSLAVFACGLHLAGRM